MHVFGLKEDSGGLEWIFMHCSTTMYLPHLPQLPTMDSDVASSSRPAGDRVYHPRQGAAAAQDLSKGGVRPDAGLLAEGAPHET